MPGFGNNMVCQWLGRTSWCGLRRRQDRHP